MTPLEIVLSDLKMATKEPAGQSGASNQKHRYTLDCDASHNVGRSVTSARFPSLNRPTRSGSWQPPCVGHGL